MQNGSGVLWPLAVIVACVALIAFGDVKGTLVDAYAVSRPADWLGFWGAMIGSAATIAAGLLAFWVSRRGIAEARNAATVSILTIERDRILAEMPGLHDARSLAIELGYRAVSLGSGTKRIELCRAVFEVLNEHVTHEKVEFEAVNVRHAVEMALPRTHSMVREELFQCLRELQAVFGDFGFTYYWHDGKEDPTLRESVEKSALERVVFLRKSMDDIVELRMSTYRLAETLIAERIGELHSAASV